MDSAIEYGIERNLKRKQSILKEGKAKKAKCSQRKKTSTQIQKELMKALVHILIYVPDDLIELIVSYLFYKLYTNFALLTDPNLETSGRIIQLYSDSLSNLYVVEEDKLQSLTFLGENRTYCTVRLDILEFTDNVFILKNSIFVLDGYHHLYVNKNFEIQNHMESTFLKELGGNYIQSLFVDDMFVYIGTPSRLLLFQPQSPYPLIRSYKIKALYEKKGVEVVEWKLTTECESTNLFICSQVQGDDEMYILKKQSLEEQLIIERKWSLNTPYQKISVLKNILLHQGYLYLVFCFHIQIYPEESTKSKDLLQTLSLNKGVYCNGPIAILKNQLYVSVQAERTKIYVWT